MNTPQFVCDWPRAFGQPVNQATLRTTPADFQVDEIPQTQPSGAGEHLWLRVRKENQNTRWVAERLAQSLGVAVQEVGFAGMKDRRAVTQQWFSLPWPIKAPLPDLEREASDGFQVLEFARHGAKLRRGMLEGNRFKLVLRAERLDPVEFESRLERVLESGAPNYFGEQRFGREGDNLVQAAALRESRRFGGRQRRGAKFDIYLSAARAFLFNEVVAARVRNGSWQAGDGSPWSATGPLWGRGRLTGSQQQQALESETVRRWPVFADLLEHTGLQQERRPMILRPDSFEHRFGPGWLELEFTLAAGCYATSLLRELVNYQNFLEV